MRETVIKRDKAGNPQVIIRSPWLSREEAAMYLDCSLSTFIRTVADRLPHRKLGRMLQYHINDLDRIGSKQELAREKAKENEDGLQRD